MIVTLDRSAKVFLRKVEWLAENESLLNLLASGIDSARELTPHKFLRIYTDVSSRYDIAHNVLACTEVALTLFVGINPVFYQEVLALMNDQPELFSKPEPEPEVEPETEIDSELEVHITDMSRDVLNKKTIAWLKENAASGGIEIPPDRKKKDEIVDYILSFE